MRMFKETQNLIENHVDHRLSKTRICRRILIYPWHLRVFSYRAVKVCKSANYVYDDRDMITSRIAILRGFLHAVSTRMWETYILSVHNGLKTQRGHNVKSHLFPKSVAKQHLTGKRVSSANIDWFSDIGANWVNAFAPGSVSKSKPSNESNAIPSQIAYAYISRTSAQTDQGRGHSALGKDPILFVILIIARTKRCLAVCQGLPRVLFGREK